MKLVVGFALIAVITVGVLFMINGVGLFAPSKRPRPQDDPEVLNGLIARVTRAISAAAAGAVSFTVEGLQREIAAKSVDGSSIQAGTDVVIDRIVGNLAFVERWEAVEGRL
jgi:hypothetical protein